MQELINYPEEEHDYIIKGGIMMYEYQKKCGKKQKTVEELKTNVQESKILMLEREKNVELGEKVIELEGKNEEILKKVLEMERKSVDVKEQYLNREMDVKMKMLNEYNQKIQKKDEQIMSIRDDILKKEEVKYNYIKKELEIERENRKNEINRIQDWLNTEKNNNEYLKKRYETDLEKEVNNKIQCYKDELEQLKQKNQEYFDKYENKNKGKIFEEEFFSILEEYNDKEEGNKWKISHVGSKYGGMCDIIFQHKDTGQTILVESKNNLQKNPVPTKDVDKFYRDVLDDTNNAIGGIIVATSKIQKKRSYEREVVQNKILIFLSHFCLENIGQLFCNLEYIIGENQVNNNDLNKEDRNELLVKQFNYYIDEGNFHKTRSKRAYDKAEEIREIYYKLNQEDIKLLKNDDKKEKKGKKGKKSQDSEINYDNLEEKCDKIKKINNEKQTKFYLKYKNEKGEIILQYFPDNYKTKKRLNKLESEGKDIITHSMMKKEEKVLKKEKIVDNIKINTIFD
jgi:hypothetical protein